MSNILETIAKRTRERVAKKQYSIADLERMKEEGLALPRRASFLEALKQSEISFICEVKKASPSKGLIAPDFPYVQIAEEYTRAGAAAISVLTEPDWFLGSEKYLKEISEAVKTPLLRKDFTVDVSMIYEARLLGASAVLLICAILDEKTLKNYLAEAEAIGLDALVEAHNAEEISMAISAGAKIIGVNNRNLKDFTVDFENTIRLREMIPENVVYVAESGVKTREDVDRLRGIGADAILIGETLMRSPDKKKMLDELRENISMASG